MKRKVEPTGGTAAAEDEGSQVLWVVGQEQEEEEHASNFLSALPDLALGAVLDCLQQQESGAPTLRRDDDSKRSRSLPELYRLETLHKEFLNYQEGLWYEEDSDESSSDEWMDELAGRHRPPAHFPFEELMENDPPGRWASPSLLALRLTCRSVKWAVEAVARRGLFPQFELFTSVDRWLTSRIELPTVLVAASPEEAHHRHLIRELESAAIACANAHMHQLRLDAYLDLLLGATSEKRASLAQTLNCELSSGAEGADDGRARLRVEYTSHAGDFLGCEAGMGVESCLSLSLPGQPREVLRILCSATGRGLGREELLLEVFLDLHTTSLAWSQALDLGLGEQQPVPGPISTTRSTPSNGGVTKPLLTWQEVRQFPTMNSNDKLLGKIWRALGFTTVTRRRLARRRVERDRKEKAAGIGWDCADVEKVLLAGLGYAWPFQANGARVMGRPPYVTKWLRQAECFLQRTTQLEQLPQKLRGLRHVRRAIGQFFGQRRIALVGPALERLRKTRAGTTPDPVQSGRQAAESSPTFLGALRFVEGRSISVELMGDQQHPFTSSSVRWAVRLPGTTTAAAGGGHNDQPRNEKRRRVGPHLDKTSSLAQTNSDSNSDNNNDEMRGGAGGRLVFAYDHKLSVRSGAPNTWHERLAVRAVVPDHQQLEGYGAGEEHELYVSQRIDDVDPRDDMSYDMLADIGRLLGLRPTVATTTTTTASSLSSQEEEDEEERFGEEVANLLVMVAKVAMWGAHITLPPPCAVNQELADHLDRIAEADHHHLTVADSDAQPPPPPLPAVPSPAAAADIAEVAAAPPSSAARVTASVQFVEAYLREPWPVGDESGLG